MSKFINRPYQDRAISDCIEYLDNNSKKPSICVAPTGSGKSILVAQAAKHKSVPTLVLQPSIELLKQNVAKMRAYGESPTIYSASAGIKEISELTYATLGSIKKMGKDFKALGVERLITDEVAYGYPPEEGSMFMDFVDALQPKKVIGFTATPIRLKNIGTREETNSQLAMLTRMRPKYFKDIIHVTQISEMVENNYWTPLVYEEYDFDTSTLRLNSTGAEYTEASISKAVADQGINNNIYLRTKALLASGTTSILIFNDSVENAIKMAKALGKDAACVHADMPKKERTEVVDKFLAGHIKVMCNMNIFSLGFDYPELQVVIVGRPTNSFAVYYQICGRAVRIHSSKKEARIIDFGGNVQRFARLEGITIEDYPNYGWGMFSGEGRVLTNYPMGFDPYYKSDIDAKAVRDNQELVNPTMQFGKYKGKKLSQVPLSYFKWLQESGYDFNQSPSAKAMKLHLADRLEQAIS